MKDARKLCGALSLLGVIALLGGPAPAQPGRGGEPSADPSVTLDLQNAPVRTAVAALFKNAGIQAYTIAPEVQGRISIAVADVPLHTALGLLLNSAQASYAVENGRYVITGKRASETPPAVLSAAASAPSVSASRTNTSGTSGNRFYALPLDKYDAYMVAVLLGGQGVVDVPPNLLRGANGPGAAGQGGAQNNRRGGNGNGGNGGGGRGRRGGYGGG